MLYINYQTLFDLRDKYPNKKNLISSIMYYFFTNNDCFSLNSKYLYLNGIFAESDIYEIFKELDFPEIVQVLTYNGKTILRFK